jgi:hypothetical protein
MPSHAGFRRLATLAVAVLAFASGGAAFADTFTADGDSLRNATQSSIDFGNVNCGETVTKSTAVVVTRKGDTKDETTNNPNIYANGAVVNVTTAAAGAGLSAGSGSVTLSSNWVTVNQNTDSSPAIVTVSLTSTTPGGGTGSVTYTATGPAAVGGTKTFTATLPATWTTGNCSIPTTTTVSCPTSVTYTGRAQEPCTATTTGAGLNVSRSVTYSDNLNFGTATASASFPATGNYLGSSGSTTFAITKAPSSVNVTCASATYTGSALTTCSGMPVGVGTVDTSVPVSLT